MTTQVLEAWMPSSLQELKEAVDEMVNMAAENGDHPYVVNVDVRDFFLYKETLTDGSSVLNIRVRENR